MRGVTARIEVSTESRITGGEGDALWAIYDGIFAPLNKDSPCRQSLHREDFLKALASPSIVKLIAKNKGGRAVGITMFSVLADEMPLLPWINPQFFRKHWPQFWGRIIYVPTICVPLNARGMAIGRELMLGILEYMRKNGICLIGFDHSASRVPFLPDMIIGLTGGRAIGSYGERREVDHQVYWLLADVEQVPE